MRVRDIIARVHIRARARHLVFSLIIFVLQRRRHLNLKGVGKVRIFLLKQNRGPVQNFNRLFSQDNDFERDSSGSFGSHIRPCDLVRGPHS
jgi:hypothetical protein